MKNRDLLDYLVDGITAAESIVEFLGNSGFEEYTSNRLLVSAVERQFEILGEAMRRVARSDPDFATAIPEVHRIIAFRNVLAHAYDRVADETVWSTAHDDLPALLDALRCLLAQGA